jgi:hypothetical protein
MLLTCNKKDTFHLLQAQPSLIRLESERLDNNPAIEEESIVHSNGSVVVKYREPIIKSYGQHAGTTLMDAKECIVLPCIGTRVTGAQAVLDRDPDKNKNLLPHLIAATWVQRFLENTKLGLSHLDKALDRLDAAIGSYASNPRAEWLKIVAVGVTDLEHHGTMSETSCLAGFDDASCSCSVHLPHLFSPSLYKTRQVPLLIMDLHLNATVTTSAVEEAKQIFRNTVPDAKSLGMSVCLNEIGTLISRQACNQSPPAQNCTHEWVVDIFDTPCRSHANEGVDVVSPPDLNPNATFNFPFLDLQRLGQSGAVAGISNGKPTQYCVHFRSNICSTSNPQSWVFHIGRTGELVQDWTVMKDGRLLSGLTAPRASSRTHAAVAPEKDDFLLSVEEGCHQISIVLNMSTHSTPAPQVCLFKFCTDQAATMYDENHADANRTSTFKQ